MQSFVARFPLTAVPIHGCMVEHRGRNGGLMYKPWTLTTTPPFAYEVCKDCICLGEAHRGLHESSGANNAERSGHYPTMMAEKAHQALNRRLGPSIAQAVESSAAERASSAASGAEGSLHAKAKHCPTATASAEQAPTHEKERMDTLHVVKLHEWSQLPVKSSEGAAGSDLFSADSGFIPAGGCATMPTGISLQVPEGTCVRVAPRSGLAAKQIHNAAGVIDADCRGEVKVILYNHGTEEFPYVASMRIAQTTLARISNAEIVEVTAIDP